MNVSQSYISEEMSSILDATTEPKFELVVCTLKLFAVRDKD